MKNVFWREIRANWKGMLFWAIGSIILIWTSMIKYQTLNTAGQSITELMSQFPRSIQVITNISGFDLGTISGYFGVMFLYIALLCTIHAILLGSNIIAKEERDKTSEFLFTKPISRTRVITAKLLAGFVNLIIMNIVITLSSLYYVDYYGNGESITSDILLLMAALFCMQLLFFFIGTAIAAVIKRARAAASVATSVLLSAFIMAILVNFDNRFDILKYLTPFKYFDAKNIMADGHLSLFYLLLSLAIVIFSIGLTYRAYAAKDLDD